MSRSELIWRGTRADTTSIVTSGRKREGLCGSKLFVWPGDVEGFLYHRIQKLLTHPPSKCTARKLPTIRPTSSVPFLTRSLASPTRQKQPSSTCLAWSLREVLQTRSCVLRGQRGSLQNFGASSQGFQAGLPNLYPPAISAVQTCACRLRAVFRGGVTMPLSPYSIHPWALQVSFGRADSGIGCTLTANRSQSPRVGAAFLSVSDFF